MERRPFTKKDRLSLKRFVRALPCVIGYLISLFFIGRNTGGIVTIILMFASAFAFFILYIRLTHHITLSELVVSPCPKCGQSPMRFDRSSQGDYTFICDQCQIEWTLPVNRQQ